MIAFFDRLLDISPEERPKVWGLFLYAFFTAGAYVVGRVVADSLFLSRQGADSLPLVYAISGIGVVLVLVSYSRLTSRMKLGRLVMSTLLILALCSFLFRQVMFQHPGLVGVLMLMYLLAELRGSLNTIQFSTLMNEVFQNSDPKRVVGLCSFGSTLAGILFGAAISWGVESWGTTNLLYVVASLELLALWPAWILTLQLEHLAHTSTNQAGKSDLLPEKPMSGLHTVWSSTFALSIAGLVAISVLVGTMIDFEWKTAAAHTYQNSEDGMASYFAGFHGTLFLLIGLLQLTVTGPYLKKYGMLVALWSYPGALLGTSLLGLGASGEKMALWAATLTKGCTSLKRAIHDPALQMLYWPLSSVARRQVITFTNGVVKPFSEVGAGLLVFGLGSTLSVRMGYYGVLILLGAWAILAIFCRHYYVRTLSEAIRQGRFTLGMETWLADQAAIRHLERALTGPDEQLAANALEMLKLAPNHDWGPTVLKQLNRPSATLRKLAIDYLAESDDSRYSLFVLQHFHDPAPTVRASAVLAFCRIRGPEVAAFVEPYLDDADAGVAAATARGLVNWCQWSMPQFGEQRLMALLRARDRRLRLVGIEILANAKVREWLGVWLRLFEDTDRSVAVSAIRAAGQTQHPELFLPLIGQLERPETSGAAVMALAAYGPTALPELTAVLDSAHTVSYVQREIAKIFRFIVHRQSFDAAISHLEIADEVVKGQMLETVYHLHSHLQCRLTPLQQEWLENTYRSTVRQTYVQLARWHELQALLPGALVTDALHDYLRQLQTGLIHILSVLYAGEDWEGLLFGLRSKNPRTQEAARELLSNVIDGELKPAVTMIWSNRTLTEKVALGRELFEIQSGDVDEHLLALLRLRHAWLQAASLYEIGQRNNRWLIPEVRRRVWEQDYLVRESALFACRNLLSTTDFHNLLASLQNGDDPRMVALAKRWPKNDT